MTIATMTDLISAHRAHMRAAGMAANTVEDRIDLLRRVDADLPCGLEQATTEELADWLARDSTWSRATRATYYGHLRGFFVWACNPHAPKLDWDPSAGLTRPRVPQTKPRPVNTAEVTFALEHLDEPWRTYVLLAAFAGLRCCEVAAIRRQDITEDMMLVRGKGDRTRLVPTHPVIWRNIHDRPDGPIAWRENGSPPTAGYVSNMTGWHLRRIGLRGVGLHRYRHWFATSSLNAVNPHTGQRVGDLRKTQELLGHASPATTAIYTLVTDEERRAVIHALPTVAAAC